MNHTRRRALTEFTRLAAATGRHYRLAAAQHGYRVTDLTPGDVEYVDTEWDGSEAEASYPNPTDEDTDLEFLADHYLFPPADMMDGERPPKSAFKGPIRQGPGGPVNVQALVANLQAINGARGGFDGIDTSTLQNGYEAAVDHLVSAGFYDSADDAPEMDVEAARITAEYDFDMGDTATWAEDSPNQAYGIIRDRAQEGENNFADRIDGDFALDATEDNPAYLLEILDEREDAWVPSGTMVGHRQETLSMWSPDKGVEESADGSAVGTVQFTVQAATADDTALTPLTGIIWGSGDHDLSLGGQPTGVHVPAETIRPTFDALQEDIEAGDVTLGFDHPGPDSVAAKTGIVDIGTADDVALTDDGDHIVLTDSTLTNDQAVEAAQEGEFDTLDWSVVADVAVRRDDNGNTVTTDDGRLILDATRIKRIDAVESGAVDAASIERGTDPLPDLSTEATAVRQAAAEPTPNHTTDAVNALRASSAALATDTDTHSTMGKTPSFDPNVGHNVPDEVREQLTAAADIIDDQQDRIDAAEAKATGFDRLLSAHDIDADEFDSPEAAAQAVIDNQTESLRQEIASLEADLAKYDVTDTDARAEELAGSDPDDLRNTLNARKAEAYDRERKRRSKGRAAAKSDATGRSDLTGGSSAGGNADADEIALKAMDGRDRINAETAGLSPSEYIDAEYGIDAARFDAADKLNQAIINEMEDDR